MIRELYNRECNSKFISPFASDSDDELLKHLIKYSSYTADSLAAFAATVIDTNTCDVLILAAFGRVDAAEVASTYNRGSKRGAKIAISLDYTFAANILGLTIESNGELRVDQANTVLCDGMTRERATHHQALYAAQRVARAGGQPVDPALVAAAYPKAQVGPEHTRDFMSEMEAWVAGKLAASAAVQQDRITALAALTAEYSDKCNTAAESARAANNALSAYKAAAEAAAKAASAAEAAAAAAAKVADTEAAAAAAAAAKVADTEPVTAPADDLRGAVAGLTKAVAALAKLLADRAAGQPAAGV
jgi:hypothetical protein